MSPFTPGMIHPVEWVFGSGFVFFTIWAWSISRSPRPRVRLLVWSTVGMAFLCLSGATTRLFIVLGSQWITWFIGGLGLVLAIVGFAVEIRDSVVRSRERADG